MPDFCALPIPTYHPTPDYLPGLFNRDLTDHPDLADLTVEALMERLDAAGDSAISLGLGTDLDTSA